MARVLLENKADVNASNKFQESALLWASVHGMADVAKILIKYDADVNTKSSFPNTYTAVQWAIRKG